MLSALSGSVCVSLVCLVSYEEHAIPPLCSDFLCLCVASSNAIYIQSDSATKWCKMKFSGPHCTVSRVTSHLPQIIIHTSSQEVHVWNEQKIVRLPGGKSNSDDITAIFWLHWLLDKYGFDPEGSVFKLKMHAHKTHLH